MGNNSGKEGQYTDELSPSYSTDVTSFAGDNAWMLTASALVCLQSVPGLMILYGGVVKKKWAVNSAFMALYAFAVVLVCWCLFSFEMSFGETLYIGGKKWPLFGKPATVFRAFTLNRRALLPSIPFLLTYSKATLVFFQFSFAGITPILIAGGVLGRMNFLAWMIFVPLWHTFSYAVGAFSVWGGGFLFERLVIDYAGGYVIHLSAGTAAFVAAAIVGPRLQRDRERFPPNNVILTLAGAGILWIGWTGFNGGAPYAANSIAALAILNTHLATAVSLIVWTLLDYIFLGKPSVIGAVQGIITGLVIITPAAGLVDGWAALCMGIISGSVPWFTMMILGKKVAFLKAVDDTLGVIHTHGVAGSLGGLIVGLVGNPRLIAAFFGDGLNHPTAFFESDPKLGGKTFGWQIGANLFIVGWNIVWTSVILLFIKHVLRIPLRMSDEHLDMGDAAAHGEEAYALYGDGILDTDQKGWYDYDQTHHGGMYGAKKPAETTAQV